jgi:hypothetical protein
MVPDATTAASGGSLLYDQCVPFAILKSKNRKTVDRVDDKGKRGKKKKKKKERKGKREKGKLKGGQRGGPFPVLAT